MHWNEMYLFTQWCPVIKTFNLIIIIIFYIINKIGHILIFCLLKILK